ncbi:CoA:oxalate CoA-transferase [Bradyrhizobium ottawaense]
MQLADKHEGTTTKTFAGLRVLDFSTTIAGPHCARMLADMGAEVIKIETDGGETMRTRPPLRKGCSTAFGQLNVGKKSVVLDLKSEDGKEAVRRLAATSDILVENFRPGVMHRLRLDYDRLRTVNPKLIYCSISGYGQTGPSAELPAYAPVIHAASGYDMAHLAYQPGRNRPDYCGIYHADVVTGTYGFGAIASALYQRTVTGLGQHIDVSMLESMLSLTLTELQSAQFAVKPPPRPMFGPTETASGYVMITVASEKTFQGLMGVIGHPEWISDPRFATYARAPRELGRGDGRRRGLVAAAHDRCVSRSARGCRRAGFGLSHRVRGAGRSAACAPAGALRGAGRGRLLSGAQPAIPDVGCRYHAGQDDGRARRAYGCPARRDQPRR